MTMMLGAAAAIVGPIALGALLGVLLRTLMRGRFSGLPGLLGCLLLPTAVATLLTIRFPLVGLWDGVTEGFLCAVGILWTAHRFYTDPRNVADSPHLLE